MDDSSIVTLFLLRDESAIANASEKYGRRLRTLADGMLRDAQAAEECENDTYFNAWNAIPPHEPRTYLYAFLARITRHLALNRCRDSQRLKRAAEICELSDELTQCLPAPDDVQCRLDDEAFAEVVNRFLAGLGSEKRNVFLRRYWYLDSIADVSARFGISESKVKTMLFRCREQFRKYLEKEGYVL